MRDLKAVVLAATDTRNPEEYIRRVKAAIHDEIILLDPTAEVEDTNYYSHSAIPDFVVRWGKNQETRHVFIRDNLENVAAARDAEYIPDVAPAVITLDMALSDNNMQAEVARQVELRPGALVTTVGALDVVDDAHDSGSPLSSLVRNNFVRGAQGMIGTNEANVLVSPTGDDTESGLGAVGVAISKFFEPHTALRINRTTELLRLAVSAPQEVEAAAEVFSGKLDQAELVRILPWLLSDDRQLSEAYLRQIGKMFEFADLEKLYDELSGIDITPLVQANEDRWVARRAYSGLYVPNEEPLDEQKSTPSWGWNFRGRTVGKDLPEVGGRISVAHSGTKLKGRPSATTATWQTVEPKLQPYRLIRVDLRGLRRSVSVNAEQSDDIRQDIADITTSVEDTYYVQSVTVRTDDGKGSDVDTVIDFGQSLAVSHADCVLKSIIAISRDFLVASTGAAVSLIANDSDSLN